MAAIPILLHQPGHPLPIDRIALAPQPSRHPTTPIKRRCGVLRIEQPHEMHILGDLLFAQKPITIYLRWHEADLLALSPLIKFVWEAMINELITAYDLAPDQSQCQYVLLDIEEAGRTGIPNLPEHASTLRSRNISISCVFQDRSQGYA